jgi:membrane-bound lytic murein transglycosylase B
MSFLSGQSPLRATAGGLLIAFVVALLFLLFSSPAQGRIDSEYESGAQQLVERLRARGFAEEELLRLLADERTELYPHITIRSGKGFNYMSKRFGLLKKDSVARGKRFLIENQEGLLEVERSYGVEKEILAAILRIETNFGRSTGRQPIFNSLLTLALVENRRSQWAEGELVHLLTICRERGLDPLSIRGSWAGAFGMAQFIPSSYVRYAVDGNGDGVVDLFDARDAAASIANYLKAHGWERNRPKENRQAVYAYNHCDNYVRAVFAYARALKQAKS